MRSTRWWSSAGDSLVRTGSLRIANDHEERAELEEELEALRADGFAAEWVDGSELKPAGRFVGAIFHPPDAAMQPGRWVRRLAVLAAEAGAEIRENDARRVARRPRCRAGRRRDGRLSERPAGRAREPRRSRRAARWWPRRRSTSGSTRARTTRGTASTTGSRPRTAASSPAGSATSRSLEELTTDERTTPVIQEALEAFVAELAGRPVEITHRWAGLFGLVLDFLPVVGRVPGDERAWIAGGYSGHGNVLGFLCGELVAGALLGQKPPELALFDPARLL